MLSVAPDLILPDASAGPPEAISLLRAARVNYVTVPQGFDPASVTARVTVVADALGVSEIGAALVERIEDEFLDLSQRTSKEPHLKKTGSVCAEHAEWDSACRRKSDPGSSHDHACRGHKRCGAGNRI